MRQRVDPVRKMMPLCTLWNCEPAIFEYYEGRVWNRIKLDHLVVTTDMRRSRMVESFLRIWLFVV